MLDKLAGKKLKNALSKAVLTWQAYQHFLLGIYVVVRRGAGIPKIGEQGRGDQVIQFKVEIPKKLSSRQEELLRELAGELGENVREKRGLFGRKK